MSAAEQELNLWSVLAVVVRRWRIVFVVPIVAGLAVSIYSLLRPREWIATGSFVSQEAQRQSSNLGALASSLGITAAGSNESPQFYADLIRSRGLLWSVATRKGPTTADRRDTSDLLTYFKVDRHDGFSTPVDVTDRLRDAVTVSVDAKTAIVQVEAKDRSPFIATRIATDLIAAVDDFNRERRRGRAETEESFAQERLRVALDSLNVAEDKWTDWQQHNAGWRAAPALQVEAARLQRAVDFRQALYLNLAQSTEAAREEAERNTPTIVVIDNPMGFVEPKPRNTLARGIGTMFVTGIFAVAFAFLLEYASQARNQGSPALTEISERFRGRQGRGTTLQA